MAQPPAYNRTKDFGADYPDQTDNQAINTELDAAAASINGIRANLALIQRDDGGLRDGIVTKDSLSSSLKDELYAEFSGNINDSVLEAQQAAVEATNAALAANADAATASGAKDAAQTAATGAQASAAAASGSQAAAAGSATSAANSAVSATSSASAASGSAGSAATSATTATNAASDASTSATTASGAAATATTAKNEAQTSATAAGGSATAAAGSALLAQDWAAKMGSPVAGSDYSAKYYAQMAMAGAGLPLYKPDNIPTTNVGDIYVDGTGVFRWKGTAYAVADLSLIEVGSNTLGTYYKFASGDMICFLRVSVTGVVWTPGSPSYGQITGITFPAAFVAAPRPVGMTAVDTDVSSRSAYLSSITSITATTAAVYVSSPNSSPPAGGTITVTGTIVGRWKA
ncbi:hypothetical protein ACOTCG_28020 [Achromobacter xylosoxidans]